MAGYNGVMIWWTTLALAAPQPLETPITASVDPTLLRALSARHAAPCDRVTATSSTPVADLLAVVAQVTVPPWAPMRAADCLIRAHAAEPEVSAALRQWVADPELKGLGRLVVVHLDELDEPLALDLAARAWEAGHDRDYVARHLADSPRPAIRAVAR